MEYEINDIDDLIGKVLSGESTPDERARLDAWLAVSDENRKYFDQVKLVFEKAASAQVQMKFDTDAAWEKVKSRLRTQPVGKSVRLGFEWWPALRIAAGVIMVLTSAVLMYRWYNQPVQTFAFSSSAITAQDTLPDGSTAFLNKNSSLQYEFNPRKKTRSVKLKGEGFFDVKHNDDQPFVIETEEVLVRDIGTTFNVKAWPGNDTVEVVVKTGVVQFYTLQNAGINLKAGETGIYSKRLREFSKLTKADTNTLAYKTGILSFNNTDLKSVIEKINEVYDAYIRLENPALHACRLTVTFRDDTVDTMVEIIAETFGLTITRKENEILLSGTGCN
ncbi:MAG: FecR domain-containing protein [Cyclobacteriaceae bacterium]|nr:FecR domain-containing protein [Cyclobacteriaceae bacterium]